MTAFLVNGLLALGFLVAAMPETTLVLGFSAATLLMDQELPSKHCRYSRAYGMIQVRCANLGLEGIPANLKTEIQILDASVNRLRELTNDSLASYTNLEYLYLGDNFIQEIEEAAFDNLRYLKVLDLSTNGCDKLPKSLLQSPYLRKLYLCQNKLTDDLFQHLEVKAPLSFLQLSRNRLGKIPQLGPVPTLIHLNVSGNSIERVSPEDLAPFCSLEILDFSRNPVKLDGKSCECQRLKSWLQARGIRSRPALNCTLETAAAAACSESPVSFTNRTMEVYENCANILRLRAATEQARHTWILVACCISGFLLCLFLALFCVHKRNKERKRKLKEEQRLNASNANTELLKSNPSGQQPENT